jgi:hypothetical protein
MAKLSPEELAFTAKKLAANKARNALRQQRPQGPSRLDTEQRSRRQREDAITAELETTSPSVAPQPALINQLKPGQLIDVDFSDIKANVENAKAAMTPDGRVMKTGNQREWKPGEQHPQCKYSDATIRLTRALIREAGARDTTLMMAGIMPAATVIACGSQAGYRLLAVPRTEDYERARHVYQNYLKDELFDRQQLLNYQVRAEKEHQRMLKSKGIHITQLPEGQWDANAAFTAAGDGLPSRRKERQHRVKRR